MDDPLTFYEISNRNCEVHKPKTLVTFVEISVLQHVLDE